MLGKGILERLALAQRSRYRTFVHPNAKCKIQQMDCKTWFLDPEDAKGKATGDFYIDIVICFAMMAQNNNAGPPCAMGSYAGHGGSNGELKL
jgi:hypothetical protein